MGIREDYVDMYGDEDLLFADGYDDAIMGVSYDWNNGMRVVYSTPKIIQTLINDGMTYEEALEFFEFNISGAYVGERTPIFVQTLEY